MMKLETVKTKTDKEVMTWAEVQEVFHIGEFRTKTLLRKNGIKPLFKGYYEKEKIMKLKEKWNESKYNQ